jgi:hypothetical protein
MNDQPVAEAATYTTHNTGEEHPCLSGLRTRDCSSQAAAGLDHAVTEIGIQADNSPINGSKLSTAGTPKTSRTVSAHGPTRRQRRAYI